MSVSIDDFSTACRALAGRACTLADLRRGFRAQSAMAERGRPRPLREVLAAEGLLPIDHPVMVGPPSTTIDPKVMETVGQLLLQLELAHEYELDRIADLLNAPPDPRTLPAAKPPRSLDRYDIAWEVGRGRSGAVFRALRREGASVVAIKVFRPGTWKAETDLRAFLHRVRSSPAPADAAFVRVIEAGEADGTGYVVMEFVEGPTLASLLDERKLSLRRGFEILERAARALSGPHTRGEAHGSLTSSEIMVEGHDRPRIAGFGWASGGSPQEDVLALGRILYEIAAGVRPFGGFRPNRLRRPSDLNPQAAGPVDRIVLKALARDPARRYPDAGALADDLGRFLRREEVTADISPEEASLKPAERIAETAARGRRRLWIVGAAAAAALLIAGVWTFRGRSPKRLHEDRPPAAGTSKDRSSAHEPEKPASPEARPPTKAPAPAVRDRRREALARKGPLSRREELDFQYEAVGALAQRDFEKLERLAEEALLRGPERDWAHYWAAIVSRERGDMDQALEHASRALELGSQETYLRELRLEVFLDRAEYRKALDEVGRVYPDGVARMNNEIRRLTEHYLPIEPKNPGLYLRRGLLLHARKLFDKAIDDFSRAAALGESRAHYARGLSLWAERRAREADEAIRAFLALHPSGPGSDEARTALEEIEREAK